MRGVDHRDIPLGLDRVADPGNDLAVKGIVVIVRHGNDYSGKGLPLFTAV